MDMSVIEAEEKPVDVNEVSEYAAEIHEYLRELEVRDSTASRKPLRLCLTQTACFNAVLLFSPR